SLKSDVDLVVLHAYYLYKMQKAYLLEAYKECFQFALKASEVVTASTPILLAPEHYFYYSLILTTIYPTATRREQWRHWRILKKNQKKMRRWAKHCPENFLHKYLLVAAEMARISDQPTKAMDLYEQAIHSARENEFTQNEAIANELTAKFYLARGQDTVAQVYMAAAHTGYSNWGATAKVQQVEQTYPTWFVAKKDIDVPQPRKPADDRIDETLDFQTVMKASQTISGEIVFSQLLESLMQIVIENVGAQRGYLLLERAGDWSVVAIGQADETDVVSVTIIQMDADPDEYVARSIINYVSHTEEVVVLSEATESELFQQDPFIVAHQSKSLLCVPLLNQGRLGGLLYLENNLMSGAFTPDRLTVLQMLSTQIAISLENARLYEGLQQEVVERMKAETIAQANEARFRHLFENAPLCVFELDMTQTPITILAANQQAEEVYGWPVDIFVKMSLSQILPAQAAPDLTQWLTRSQLGESMTSETVNIRQDGTIFPVRLSVTPEVRLGQERMILIVEDITAEKERQAELATIEGERRRIAGEIHDGLGQTLAGLRLRMRMWRRLIETNPEQVHSELDEVREILNNSIQEVRRSIYALRPVALEELGFFPALRDFLDNFAQQHNLHIDFKVEGNEAAVPASLELLLFRVLQEGMNNISKHSQATRVSILLKLDNMDKISVVIEDNGQGFELDSLSDAYRLGHVGLVQMRERIEQVGGQLLVESELNHGVRLDASFPLI
ncbi:MAG: histidine kinase, partial [Chloroflexota bacterium]